MTLYQARSWAFFFLVFIMAAASFPVRAMDGEILTSLGSRDFLFLDKTLNTLQADFEINHATEIQLRDAFRPFYKLDINQQDALRAWAQNFPKSYAAHLALGIFLKRAGWEARGSRFISETSQAQIAEMHKLFGISQLELNRSLALSTKPYLSIFHLLDIARAEGDDEQSHALLARANKMLPNNRLARNRYLISLAGGMLSQKWPLGTGFPVARLMWRHALRTSAHTLATMYIMSTH